MVHSKWVELTTDPENHALLVLSFQGYQSYGFESLLQNSFDQYGGMMQKMRNPVFKVLSVAMFPQKHTFSV